MYGAEAARYLGVTSAPTMSVATLRKAQLAVTRLRSEQALRDKTKPVPPEPAFSILLHLRDAFDAKLWYGNRQVDAETRRHEGSVTILDLEREPSVYLGSHFDMLQFYVPRAALNELTDDHGRQRCKTLSWPHAKIDPLLWHLGASLIPALERPELACRLYIDHVVLALHAYVAHAYGGVDIAPPLARGGLARWQIHRATELLRANLEGKVSLSEVARDCELSVSHFVHAFKQSLGKPPYQWLIDRRIDAAKYLLLNSRYPLADIALRCGFADQTCLIRAFRSRVRMAPGEWRRRANRG
jgi:AraC family transcriptional regulator